MDLKFTSKVIKQDLQLVDPTVDDEERVAVIKEAEANVSLEPEAVKSMQETLVKRDLCDRDQITEIA